MTTARSERGTGHCSGSDKKRMSRCLRTSPCRHGFTLVELLVVIAVIGLLAGLLIVAVGGARRAAQDTSDRSRLRGLAQAAQGYAADMKGRLPSPRTSTPSGWTSMKARPGDCPGGDGGLREELALASDPAAVKYRGWICSDSTQCAGAISGNGMETAAALEGGSLFSYLGSLEAYQSPMDATGRLRSYSINAWVGVLYADDAVDTPGKFRGGDYATACSLAFDTRTGSRILQPSATAMFVGDNDPMHATASSAGWNLNGMLFNPNPRQARKWFDLPAVWQVGQATVNMSFVDASTGAYRIQSDAVRNQETSQALRGADTSNGVDISEEDPSYADLLGLSRYALPGSLKTIAAED